MYYSVDRIEDDIVVLENIKNNNIIEIDISLLPKVKESDIVIFRDGKYQIDNKAKLERIKIINEKLNKLKR